MTVLESSTNETPLQKELGLFKEYFVRLTNATLNKVFDLQPENATGRRTYLIFLLFLSYFLITLTHENYSLSQWALYLQDIFLYLFNPIYATSYVGNPFENFLLFMEQAFTDPYVLQYVPILLAPFFIALQSAAVYLADIFELEDIRVARKFVRAVALSGGSETIRISEGEILEASRRSPCYLIGGPGKVVVDIDSAAIFEKPDGTPRVIGPTAKESGGRVTLAGFERFRQGIDLRDRFIPLSSLESDSRSVSSRTLDGIPVSAVDVQVIFSVFRNNKQSTNEVQYPFSKKAVEQLVYTSTSKVTLHLPEASSYAFIWERIALSTIRGELSKFMSTRKLSEYLASFGSPEVDKAKERENAIAAEERQLIPRFESDPEVRPVLDPPLFMPRDKISDLFNQFANEFATKANKKGVEFRWTGIGTWKTPMEIVSNMHFEAWKLTKENIFRGSDFFIKQRGAETGLQAISAMIQDVPLGVYIEFNLESKDRTSAVNSLLEEYQRQLTDIDEFLKKNERRIPPTLVAALAYMVQIFTPSHFIQRTAPIAKTEREQQLNEELQSKIGECNGVVLYNVMVELVELERRFFPNAQREELLERINRDWDLDIEGKWQS